jgi:hypothetical protein
MAIISTTSRNPLALLATAAKGKIPRGYVRLSCGDPALEGLLVLLGPDAPRVTGGVGGWEAVARPRSVGMTIWDGIEPFAMDLSLMFDNYAAFANDPHTGSEEANLRALMRVARGDGESPPGVLLVEGLAMLPTDLWVINGMDYGDPILDYQGGRVRQPLTLNLMEYVPPTYLHKVPKASASSTKWIVIRARQGDTPAKIAKRRKLKGWTVIRDLNKSIPVRKANQSLAHGTRIRVPAPRAQATKTKAKHK